MNHQVPFQQVDVFTDIPFKGNPVAVVLNGNELSTEQMQAIANWTNLSETTFVCTPIDPRADYKLRIFTPNSELPFAGHPTIGSAFALLKHGLKPKTEGCLMQECGSGLVSIFIDEDKLFLTLPEPHVKSIQSADAAKLASALGIDSNSIKASATIDVGAVWMTLQLSNADEVRSLRPDMAKLATLIPSGVTGVTVFGLTSENTESNLEVRSFAPTEGVDEDPVCGSGNGCVATLVKELELIGKPNYVASQGHCVGRNGRVEVRFTDNGKILIGGHAVTCIEGTLKI
ncbi:PhzF family phenazine biosynthesis protein [Brevibacillus laterosporus]|uniref:PhzF family phenazine biosynthesis protein n=1 Tax=Brevibacillus laterosporus TaxID=1465 RepID=UPI001EF368D0|nr:PhzF family phenazine biosynthesis protein [Brevibacillus laterosporus]MCG7317810.1 PhzF family phenazine biosynthesis protein [Brevibacillus laterosporus]MED1790959.1 PhzF family phenazine biosynthesis protein [Brevibacillus laterosporus]